MPPEKTDEAFLWDMLDSAQAVQEFLSGKTLDDYKQDRMLRSAVERGIEIIGEAARGVSAMVQQSHPDIPWRAIIAQRNVIAHGYGEIDDERLWRVATQLIPELIEKLKPLI